MGIHNESGTSKHKVGTTAELVDQMLSKIVDTQDKDRSFVPFKGDGSDEVVLLVNGLGAVSELEMGGIVNEGLSFSLNVGRQSADHTSEPMALQKEYQSSSNPLRSFHDFPQYARILPHPTPLTPQRRLGGILFRANRLFARCARQCAWMEILRCGRTRNSIRGERASYRIQSCSRSRYGSCVCDQLNIRPGADQISYRL
jgi:hypothetical protein